MPAGLRVGLTFKAPYDDKWTTIGARQVFQLAKGAQIEKLLGAPPP